MNAIDVKHGGVTDWGVEIEPHSEREYLAILGKTVYEFLFYTEKLENHDSSDRIHVMVTSADGSKQGWLMNIEDALIFMRGLSICMYKAVQAGIPPKPLYDANQEEQ